jgi:hypothetical protein
MKELLKRNNVIIQYSTHIETLKLEDAEIDDTLSSAFRKSAGTLLSIIINGSIIYAKKREV